MRILLLSWEFPPRIIGGIARHVEGIAKGLAALGHEVHVVTLDFPGSPPYEQVGSLHTHRVSVDMATPSFNTWVLAFNLFFEKKVGQVASLFGRPDVVHAHDWLTVPSGISSKHLLRCPFVLTFHSTEAARSGGSTSPDSNFVHGLEKWGSSEAAKVITVSKWMEEHVSSLFGIPPGKVEVIPNGIDASKFDGAFDRESARSDIGVGPAEPLITCVGRMTPQKGFDNLLRAFPRILSSAPNSKLLLIGEGHMREELEALAKREGVADRTLFWGFVTDEQMISALKSSDVVVVPSRFEPFGITALEAMSAGVPVVVARVGGTVSTWTPTARSRSPMG
ncbi:MAG: glycosyltransferase family 4 protein [Thaumarchaeota archaeon]|nr:glycosyltransferase family 4 protein [Nitrososphaerota archaeon]